MTVWDIYDDPSRNVSECLTCEYEGTDHAESDDFIFDDETGEREVFCPDCKSSLYFIKQGGSSMKHWSKFKSDWIADAMQWGKMNRAEAEDYWDKQEYRDS